MVQKGALPLILQGFPASPSINFAMLALAKFTPLTKALVLVQGQVLK